MSKKPKNTKDVGTDRHLRTSKDFSAELTHARAPPTHTHTHGDTPERPRTVRATPGTPRRAPSGWWPVLRIRNRWMLQPRLVHFRHFPTVLNTRGELSHILGRPRGSHPPVSFSSFGPQLWHLHLRLLRIRKLSILVTLS